MWYLLGVCIQPQCSSTKQTYIETMQPRPFEEWIEKWTPTRRQPVRCLCTPHRRTFFGEGRRGVQPRLFCILCQGVWGMWRVELSLANTERGPAVRPDRLFIAKIEMATRCRGVGGEEVGVKCCFMLGCCEGTF